MLLTHRMLDLWSLSLGSPLLESGQMLAQGLRTSKQPSGLPKAVKSHDKNCLWLEIDVQ